MAVLERMKNAANDSLHTLKKKIRRFIWPADTSLYLPELSHHAVVVAFLSCIVFISLGNMNSNLNDDDNIHVWRSLHVYLFGFFYFFMHPWVQFFSQPLIGKPSYASFNKWYVSWLLIAAVDHSMGESMRMNLSLFLTIFALSNLCLLLFHTTFYGFRYIFSREVRKWPEIHWTMLQLSAAVSIACCIFLSKCKERPRDRVCSYLIVPDVGSEINNHHYPKVFSGVFPKVSTDEMHALYSLWATFIGLYIASCIAERLPASSEEYEKNKIMKPEFLDMVPWYSGTSVDLYKTVFNIVVSVNFFLGRFDMRMLQAKGDDRDFLYELHSEKDELWFDFMADTGDGGNSTYTVARLLAQPRIELKDSGGRNHTLERGNLLLIGGDIAYPNPSQFTYESRLFRPFEYALQSPSYAKQERMVVDKPNAPPEVSEPLMKDRERSKEPPKKQMKPFEGPQCFLIPGNHDWFDGLHTFMGYICHRSWLGGWFMPQRKSYFALKLPKGWWVFGLDLALHGDIDVHQFEFFSKLASSDRFGERDSVIVMTHQPDWLLDWYEDGDQHNYKHNIADLIRNILKRKCRLRIAGDIHHYMRHERDDSRGGSNELFYPQHLLVNGCGGAFLHPTHVFRNFSQSHGVFYKCEKAYPTFEKSRKLAWRNLSHFRRQNWQFDFIGGILYFILVFSMFPRCHELGTVWGAFMYMVHHSYVSLGGSVLFLMAAIAFTPSKRSWTTRIVIGFCHFSAHLVVDLLLLWLFELGVETFVQIGLLETSEYHSLYRSLESMLVEPVSTSLEQWTFGLYPACIKYVMSAFDVPELIAVTRENICKNGMESLSRGATIVYYVSVFLYFWVLSTPAVSLVFGCYLYICVNWFNLHYDEAFSSLRIANYKAFTRFHIKPDGDLEVFTLAVDKVAEDWELDPRWKGESEDLRELREFGEEHGYPEEFSYCRAIPSKWRAADQSQDPLATVRIIDHFVIRKEDPVANDVWSDPVANDVWSDPVANDFLQFQKKLILKLNKNQLEVMAIPCRKKIWFPRNDFVFEKRLSCPTRLLRSTKECLEEFQQSQRFQKKEGQASGSNSMQEIWKKPARGIVKVNWAASLDQRMKRMGVGIIARDEEGETLVAVCDQRQHVQNPAIAEGYALWKAMELCNNLNIQKVIFEGDAKAVILAVLSNEEDLSVCGSLIEDIRSVLANRPDWSIQFTYGEMNNVAHGLAKKALSIEGKKFLIEEVPAG
ncbi:uncharacterized protein LOC122299302 isoform X2 [Carya illinoinensis]|uniref:uncharacterized protein LOC122299302 isoform X2 n=1 Tax=Carya illinoinensis TaxID=32201 RepID=UPI001C7296A9|nr:uncharacterized protein LOC122299302 isoform X2 [Carya illinoinensis]